jgi:RNA polymerase sigma factor (sigma-70 family)
MIAPSATAPSVTHVDVDLSIGLTEPPCLPEASPAGHTAAWDLLVQRYVALLWGVARRYGLAPTDAADTVQIAWLRLVEHMGDIREPDRVGAWLATTVRHECLRQLRHTRREQVCDTYHDLAERADPDAAVEASALRSERAVAVRRALRRLPPRQGLLLRLLSADPAPSYAEVSAALDMPIGSIGPTRARALHRLGQLVREEGVEP